MTNDKKDIYNGIEVEEIINRVPLWVVEIGLLKPYVFFQDLFNFRFITRWFK